MRQLKPIPFPGGLGMGLHGGRTQETPFLAVDSPESPSDEVLDNLLKKITRIFPRQWTRPHGMPDDQKRSRYC